jgi:hypothetical protein
MRKIGFIILTLAAFTISCQPPKDRENISSSDSLIETKWTNFDAGEIADSTNLPKHFDKFKTTFEFENKEQKFQQKLGVTWLTNDSIEFRLLSVDDICDTNYWGTAKNNYPGMDPESDEDENGESYLAYEYVTETDTYLLGIRISLDKDRAKIIFTDKSGEDTDCIPTPDLVLVKKNAR